MDTLFDVIKYAFGGLAGLVVLAVLFGKRVEKKWDYEADFHDERGREIGELEIELSRIAREGADYTLDVEFSLRHPALEAGRRVEVLLADARIFAADVVVDGRIRLDTRQLCGEIKSPAVGQVVTVRCDDVEIFAEPLRRD